MIIKILKTIRKIILVILIIIGSLYAFLWIWNFFVKPLPNEKIQYGVTFSKPYALQLELDWKKTYLAILDDLKVRNLRLSAYWPEIEPTPGRYNFRDLDFQINEAAKRDAKIILAVGRRLPRWPECHIPKWAQELPESEQQQKMIDLIKLIVKRYDKNNAVEYWQVENEPFLVKFGICPTTIPEFLDDEIALVKSLSNKPIIITDGGEFGDWVRSRKRGDIFGTTMYRIIWKESIGYFRYPLPPTYFKFKDFITRAISKNNKTVVIEMQAEAWGPKPIPYLTLEEQFQSMDFDSFKNNILYARRTGFDEIYLWGVEWWYWLREQGDNRFWLEAKSLF